MWGKTIALLLCSLVLVGFGICGVYGVGVSLYSQVLTRGCTDAFICMFLAFGLMGIGIAVALGFAVYGLWRSIQAQRQAHRDAP